MVRSQKYSDSPDASRIQCFLPRVSCIIWTIFRISQSARVTLSAHGNVK